MQANHIRLFRPSAPSLGQAPLGVEPHLPELGGDLSLEGVTFTA